MYPKFCTIKVVSRISFLVYVCNRKFCDSIAVAASATALLSFIAIITKRKDSLKKNDDLYL